ncbi:MAG: glycosyltransferase [Candidatus Latescibacterota bacterium]|nr:glycosyltransferase [Candidatus Latescibacterota bacterium]
MSTSTRRALLVAYHYPPMRSSGVERTAKFARYLPEFGYETRVLTTSAFGKDSASDVLRAWEPLALYRRLFNRAARANPAAATRTRTRAGPVSATLNRLRRWVFVPDGQITWLPAAALSALRAARRERVDLVYTTSPPASSHLLGRYLRERLGVPWVADFRDSWVYDPLDPDLLNMPYRRELERRMEQAVAEEADLVIVATQVTASYLTDTYAEAAPRIRLIRNGFDPGDDLASPEDLVVDGGVSQRARPSASDQVRPPASGRRRLRLVHTGSFSYSHPARTPEPILIALGQLLDSDKMWRERIELLLVGELSPDEEAMAEPLVEASIVRMSGSVDRATALGFQECADVLLLVDHARPWPSSNAPSKLYEYLATRKPILALCGPGEVRTMIDDLGAGLCAQPNDAEEIRQVLIDVWCRYQGGTLPRVQGSLDVFHRRVLTRKLASCFDEVLTTS